MARTRALEDMISDVRQRADMVNSEFVSDSEITEYLNQELAELHGRLVANEGQPFFRSEVSISVNATSSGSNLYALPADFWRVQEVTAKIGGIDRNLEPFMSNERARLLNAQLYAYSASPQYRIQADNIEFLPSTQAYVARLFYVACSPRLINPTDVVDGFNGYEVSAIYGAVATCLQKEESDPSFYMAQKDRIFRHIDSLAHSRDGSHPERVTDVVGLTNILPLFPWE